MDWALGTQQALPHMTLVRAQPGRAPLLYVLISHAGTMEAQRGFEQLPNEAWGQAQVRVTPKPLLSAGHSD